MLKKALKAKVILMSSVFLSAFFIANIALAADQCTDYTQSGCNGLDAAAGSTFQKNASVNGIISQIITIALSFLGVVFVILIIYGGFIWMTARGNEQQVTKAQDLIQAAVIGLVIVVGAYAISIFLITKLQTGTLNVTT